MSTWHAVCHDCDDFEELGSGLDIALAASGHEIDTGHRVTGKRVER